ncbi:MAG TPA: YitT family protein [Flavobacteriales bacterium]|nr:YitT family protein [Flavobacteriales bacterium]
MNIDLKKEISNYSIILLGSGLVAFAMVGFLAPNHIATGGTAGLAIIFHNLLNWPIGLLMVLINIPLLAIGLKYVGKGFAFRSIFCILSISIVVDLLNEAVELNPLSETPLLATLYGGVIAGIGLGLIFRGGGSAGGGTILAKILTSRSPLKTGQIIMLLDALVVCSAGVVFRSIELALWSLISIYATSRMLDTVLTGKPSEHIVHISSTMNLEELSKKINETLGVTGTIISGKDLGQKENKDIIFILIDKNRLNTLKRLVYEYDTKSKMIVIEASQILGEEHRL